MSGIAADLSFRDFPCRWIPQIANTLLRVIGKIE